MKKAHISLWISLVLLLVLMASCTVKKRLYMPGYYLSKNKPIKSGNEKSHSNIHYQNAASTDRQKQILKTKEQVNTEALHAQNNNKIAHTPEKTLQADESHKEDLTQKDRTTTNKTMITETVCPTLSFNPFYFNHSLQSHSSSKAISSSTEHSIATGDHPALAVLGWILIILGFIILLIVSILIGILLLLLGLLFVVAS